MRIKKSFFLHALVFTLLSIFISFSENTELKANAANQDFQLDISNIGAFPGEHSDYYDASVVEGSSTIIIKKSSQYFLFSNGEVQDCYIIVGENAGDVEITLSGIELNATGKNQDIYISSGNQVKLHLLGNSVLNGGLTLDEGAQLEINGTINDSLTSYSRLGGAGIGGEIDASSGDITINGGNITSFGKGGGAGIGGGLNGDSGNIIINGGILIAYGGNDTGLGAGIGSGQGGDVKSVIINGGEVYAYGGYDNFEDNRAKALYSENIGAAGIGAGHNGNGGNVEIYGENTFVFAQGGAKGYDIGSNNSTGGNLYIDSDGSVELGMNGVNANIFDSSGKLNIVNGKILDSTYRLGGIYKNSLLQTFIILSADKGSVNMGETVNFTASLSAELSYINEFQNEVQIFPQGSVSVYVNEKVWLEGVPRGFMNNFSFKWQPDSHGDFTIGVTYEGNTALDYYEDDSLKMETLKISVAPSKPEPTKPPHYWDDEENEEEAGDIPNENIAESLYAIKQDMKNLSDKIESMTNEISILTDNYNAIYAILEKEKDSKTLSFICGERVFAIDGILEISDTAPFMSNGEIMVPLRLITETFGVSVIWHEETKTTEIIYKDKKDFLNIDQSVEFIIKNDRLMVPLHYICDFLDATVSWNQNVVSMSL